MKMNKKGFTIVELVIVIAVIAILAGVMIPTFGGVIDNANKTTAKQEASNVYKQLMAADPTINKDVIYIQIEKGGDTYTFSVTEGAVAEVTEENWSASDEYTTYEEGATITITTTTPATTYEVPANTTVYTKTPAASGT